LSAPVATTRQLTYTSRRYLTRPSSRREYSLLLHLFSLGGVFGLYGLFGLFGSALQGKNCSHRASREISHGDQVEIDKNNARSKHRLGDAKCPASARTKFPKSESPSARRLALRTESRTIDNRRARAAFGQRKEGVGEIFVPGSAHMRRIFTRIDQPLIVRRHWQFADLRFFFLP